ncbi:MAG: glycosyl hydrolase family 28 protein, partial [Lysobacterales bacterium]
TLSTKSIQSAIDEAPAGATVTIPAGHFISGSIFVKTGVTLFLEAGALLQASGDPDQFEPEQRAFIVVENAENVKLNGRGTIDGSGAFLRHLTGESGRLLSIRDSRNVTVEGLILRNARAWHTHIIRSEHVTVRDVKVLNDRYVFNTDGINPDSSRHVLIEDTLF